MPGYGIAAESVDRMAARHAPANRVMTASPGHSTMPTITAAAMERPVKIGQLQRTRENMAIPNANQSSK